MIEQPRLPFTDPTRTELIAQMLKALADGDRFRVYDTIDQLIDPNDRPTRQDLYLSQPAMQEATA